jgi:hypothetical protein
MISVPYSTRSLLLIGAVTCILIFTQIASAQCAGISEEGRWRNLDKNGEPSFIDVKMTGGCGDQVLNGEQTGNSTHYTIRVWIRQSTGKFYGRPTGTAWYRPWKGQQWGHLTKRNLMYVCRESM